jgi:RNA polymerase-binding transcription factor
MAGSKNKKGKMVKKKLSAKKVSKRVAKKEKIRVAPKKTKVTPPKKGATKSTASKTKEPAVPKMKTAEPQKEDFRAAFMKSLQAKRDELQKTLEGLIESRKEYEGQLAAGDFIDEVDDAQREISAYSQFSLIERKNKELQKIEYLLSRIRTEEDFGICEECGTHIPRERLLVVPETTVCVACQRELEKLDQRRSMAARASSTLSPTRREMSWESSEPADEDDNVLVEYHIGTLPNVDIDEGEGETEPLPEDKEEK